MQEIVLLIGLAIVGGLIGCCIFIDLLEIRNIEKDKNKIKFEVQDTRTPCYIIKQNGDIYPFKELNDKYWKLYEEILEKGDVPITYKEYV